MYKIAFFGSDLFSLASFKHVLNLQRNKPELINSVSLITRKLKVSGRGMKNIVIPPIVEFAKLNSINWYEIDADTEFNDLESISNLAVAVSYGRLIPSSYLSKLTYGGLNVHPSLLPQYRGAAPLQWSIIDQKTYSGVSVQTLHPTKFDHGKLLWQSQPAKLKPRETTSSLMDRLGEIGAKGLVEVISSADLSNPSELKPQFSSSLAPILKPSMSRIDFNLDFSTNDAMGRALGKLFFEQLVNRKKNRGPPEVRVNLTDFAVVDHVENKDAPLTKGFTQNGEPLLALRVKDGYIGAQMVTVQGYKQEPANDYFTNFEKRRLGEVKI